MTGEVPPPRRRVTFWPPKKSPKKRQGVGPIGFGSASSSMCPTPWTPHFTGAANAEVLAVNAKARVVQLTGFPSISAATEGSVTFRRCSSWWRARLCVGGAQVRLRGTAGGPVCRPYGKTKRQRDRGRAPHPSGLAASHLPPEEGFAGGSWTRPYGGYRSDCVVLVGAGPRPARQDSYRECWLGNARRRSGTAPVLIFANPGPSGPAAI